MLKATDFVNLDAYGKNSSMWEHIFVNTIKPGLSEVLWIIDLDVSLYLISMRKSSYAILAL
jgi:hypothetical protein